MVSAVLRVSCRSCWLATSICDRSRHIEDWWPQPIPLLEAAGLERSSPEIDVVFDGLDLRASKMSAITASYAAEGARLAEN